jgi:putative PIN family toxin of toxin-antitoxin system
MGREKFRRFVRYDQSLGYIDWYAGISELVAITERITACRDPRDDKFLELPVSGQADAIVTGHPDLQVMHPFRGIPILSSAPFPRTVS